MEKERTNRRAQLARRLKEDMQRVSIQTTVLLWLFSLVAIGLFIASFIVPPTGVIDPSVLKAVAWVFAFAALAEAREAIREGLGVKLTHGSTTIEVHDLDGPSTVEINNNEGGEDDGEMG